jgi:GNAT superfamily N-acetyltransferase
MYTVKPLTSKTWPDFARLVEKHNGVWGGCWCIIFHYPGPGHVGGSPSENRSDKLRRVQQGKAHAALVYDGARCVGWCQFGSPDELPGMKLKKAYEEGLAKLPDWRITCFFVDREYRHKGIASVALNGALQEIARLGGGTVESYPEDVEARSTSGSFLYNATLAMFERRGFHRVRRLGKTHWVVTRNVRKAAKSVGGKRSSAA